MGAEVQWDPATYTVRITSRTTEDASRPSATLLEATVTRIVDGDTVEVSLSGVKEKVRFTGVDCPEAGTDAGTAVTEYTRKALDGKKVYLETDVGLRDKYGRLLAYVWLSEPKQVAEQAIRSQMFNARLLLVDMAQLMTVPPNVKYVDYSTAFQREAREAKVGLWADDRDIQEPA
ncbi:MAG TPA: nuclease, partial [Clostridia bacterium]|nr:nuclease [Clostridia bacterium]